jgi:hypothetical protein
MAYTTINKSSDYFNTKLYTGNGSTQSITGVGFQPDLTWLKCRSNADGHGLFDAVRGVNKRLISDTDEAETTISGVTSFDSDGFSLGSAKHNDNGNTFVGWSWKASGSTASNTDGSITSTVSANTTSGFSIVSYTGTGSNATVGHGLNSTPSVVMVKRRNGNSWWYTRHTGTNMTNGHIFLNTTSAASTQSTSINGLSSSTFNLGTEVSVNESGGTYIAYCFAEKTGYSKFGSFEGNNNADGTFVYLGFKPSLIITKNVDTGGTNYDWLMFDNKRNTANLNDDFLEANNSDAETTSGRNAIDFLSNGFKCRTSYGDLNSNQTYIYMAFAEAPLVGTNNVPCTAR